MLVIVDEREREEIMLLYALITWYLSFILRYDQAFAFKEAVEVGSVIVTKLDGHAKGECLRVCNLAGKTRTFIDCVFHAY